ncbi:conserved hypothetical protein [Neospora caninum Liverpool]|uniref:Helicase ATP-binding domain-containing protein n=1 Tax=Neospora caninum (strain Liverpool) TaxID=572307 RepID=F0VMU1_NEOCL|nr:conserved hypothetical protein [Neospora caninum Liverpool]CBZ55037.1 conserved hypothetical protein [Neospora caninum Liverpool]|eukprot:XP_003885065.1 conserved hypothetical protein [Neospora caninum Liverpool]
MPRTKVPPSCHSSVPSASLFDASSPREKATRRRGSGDAPDPPGEEGTQWKETSREEERDAAQQRAGPGFEESEDAGVCDELQEEHPHAEPTGLRSGDENGASVSERRKKTRRGRGCRQREGDNPGETDTLPFPTWGCASLARRCLQAADEAARALWTSPSRASFGETPFAQTSSSSLSPLRLERAEEATVGETQRDNGEVLFSWRICGFSFLRQGLSTDAAAKTEETGEDDRDRQERKGKDEQEQRRRSPDAKRKEEREGSGEEWKEDRHVLSPGLKWIKEEKGEEGRHAREERDERKRQTHQQVEHAKYFGVCLSRANDTDKACASVALYTDGFFSTSRNSSGPQDSSLSPTSCSSSRCSTASSPSSPVCVGFRSGVDFSRLHPPLPADVLPVFLRLVHPPNPLASPLLLIARVSFPLSPASPSSSSPLSSFSPLASLSPASFDSHKKREDEKKVVKCEVVLSVVLPPPSRQLLDRQGGDALRLFFSWFDSVALHAAPCCSRFSSAADAVKDASGERALVREEAGAAEAQKPEGEESEEQRLSSRAEENILFIEPQFLYDCLVRAWKLFAKQSNPASSSSFQPFGDLPSLLSPPGLKCSLRPYQQRAVFFALTREWRHLASLFPRDSQPLASFASALPRTSSSPSSVSGSASASQPSGAPCPSLTCDGPPASPSRASVSASSPDLAASSSATCRSSFSPAFPSSASSASATSARQDERAASGACGAALAPPPSSVHTPEQRKATDVQTLRELSLRELRLPQQSANLVWVYVPLVSGRVLAFDSLFGTYKFLDPQRERRGSQERPEGEAAPRRIDELGVGEENRQREATREREAPNGHEGEERHGEGRESEDEMENEEFVRFDAPGGMLCDQMGLGKTVEAIALMLLHPCPRSASPLPSPAPSIVSREEDLPNDAVFDCPCGFEGMRIRCRVADRYTGALRAPEPQEGEEERTEREAHPVLLPLGGKSTGSLHAARPGVRGGRGAKRGRGEAAEEAAFSSEETKTPRTRNAGGGRGNKVQRDGPSPLRKAGTSTRKRHKRAAEGHRTAHEENGESPAVSELSLPVELAAREGDARKRAGPRTDEKKPKGEELVLPAIQCGLCGCFNHLFCIGVTRQKLHVPQPFTCVYCESEPLFASSELPPGACRSPPPSLREVKGTLVLCPAAILQQWREEIRKHTDSEAMRRTAIYVGVKHARETLRKQLLDSARRHFASHMARERGLGDFVSLSPSSSSASPVFSNGSGAVPANWLLADEDEMILIRPEQMEDVDILLVSYDTLREELWFSPRPCRSRQYGGSSSFRFSPLSFPASSLHASAVSSFSASLSSPCEDDSRDTRGMRRGAQAAEERGAVLSTEGSRATRSLSAHAVRSSLGLRRKKKYRLLASPLLRVHWWRLLIDEAQMVGGYTVAAQMARALSATFRWCVSGTPLLHASSACSSGGFCESFLGPESRVVSAGGKRRAPGRSAARNSHFPKELAGLLATLQLQASAWWLRDAGMLQQIFQPLAVGLPCSLILNQSNAVSCSHTSLSSPSSPSSSLACPRNCSSCEALCWATRRQKSSWSREAGPTWLPEERAWGRSSSLLYSLVDLLFPLFWRTNMKDVMGELGVPAPIVHDVFVDFGPVERFFYQHQQQAVRQKSSSLLSFWSPSATSREAEEGAAQRGEAREEEPGRRTVPVSAQLDGLLLTLRHACQHPQLGQLGLKKRRGRSEPAGESTGPSRPARRRSRPRVSGRSRGPSRSVHPAENSRQRRPQGLDGSDRASLFSDVAEGEVATEFMLMDEVLAKLIHEAKARERRNSVLAAAQHTRACPVNETP